MNIVATSLIILLGLSYGFARGIPDFFSESRRPVIQFPSSDEVWMEPFSGRSPFLNTDNDYVENADAASLSPKPSEESDSSQESHESDPRGIVGEYDQDLNHNNPDTDDNDLNEGKDEDNLNIDEEEDGEDQNKDEGNRNEEKDDEAQDDEDDNDKGKKEPVSPSLDESWSLYAPVSNFKQMTNYLKELQRALEQMFEQTRKEVALLNGTYANTTEEKVDINGQKFLVQKSVISTGDNNSSIFIEAVDVLPEQESNRTKRSNWFAEKAQKAKESDP